MENLMKTRMAIKTDRELRKCLLRSSLNEILLDLDGDKEADIALIDVDKDGRIDRFAADINGNGYFDLYVDDTDNNGFPDRVFLVDEENDKVEEIAAGEEVEAHILAAAQRIALLLEADQILTQDLNERLKEMDKEIRAARRQLAKKR